MSATFRTVETLGLVIVLLAPSVGWSQLQRGAGRDADGKQTTPAGADLVTRVYRVTDIVLPTPNYSFRGIQLPGAESRGSSVIREVAPGGMMGGGGMGGMGGGFGGGGMQGGGMFNVGPSSVLNQIGGGDIPNRESTSGQNGLQITMDDLIETIVGTIHTDSWEDVGGAGSIASIGGMLVIQQIPAVHRQVVQLLSELRDNGAVPRSVTISAVWLSVDGDAILRLGESNSRTVSKELLQEHASNVVARAQITCFDSQTVHLVAGRLRSLLLSYIPVVGQRQPLAPHAVANHRSAESAGTTENDQDSTRPNDVMAQVAGGAPSSIVTERDTHVGYQPVTQSVNLGMLLQVTPLLITDQRSVALDVQSIAISPVKDAEVTSFRPGMPLDSLNVNTQQFRTTLRLPLGAATLIGGMTMQPTAGENDRQLVLVMEVRTE